MIDIHCHILPGVDDGAGSMTESIEMAREATKQGIKKIIAAPHHNNGTFMNKGENIIGAVAYLNGKLKQEQIPVEVLAGQETRVYGELVADLENGTVIQLNQTSGYVFIELPTNHVPQYTTQLLFDMQIKGYIPIIVHPERNHELLENPDKLYRMVKNGALTQITAGSIVGRGGKKVQRFAYQLLACNLTHFVASDAHNLKKRGFYMKDAFRDITKRYGKALAYQLMENSELLVIGQTTHRDAPERVTMSKKWGLFNK